MRAQVANARTRRRVDVLAAMAAACGSYLLEGVAADLREDGRGRLDWRHLILELGLFPQAQGSARLRLGGTDLFVAVVAELAEPDAATPEMGRIIVSVDCGPGECAGLPAYASSGERTSASRRVRRCSRTKSKRASLKMARCGEMLGDVGR